jgi:hypothetical protein
LGNLEYVGRDLDLKHTNIQSLGNLTSVGGDLNLIGTPLLRMYSRKEIRDMVRINGNLFL